MAISSGELSMPLECVNDFNWLRETLRAGAAGTWRATEFVLHSLLRSSIGNPFKQAEAFEALDGLRPWPRFPLLTTRSSIARWNRADLLGPALLLRGKAIGHLKPIRRTPRCGCWISDASSALEKIHAFAIGADRPWRFAANSRAVMTWVLMDAAIRDSDIDRHDAQLGFVACEPCPPMWCEPNRYS